MFLLITALCVIIIMIYTMYYVNWMWISLVGGPVVVDMAVLVGCVLGWAFSGIL